MSNFWWCRCFVGLAGLQHSLSLLSGSDEVSNAKIGLQPAWVTGSPFLTGAHFLSTSLFRSYLPTLPQPGEVARGRLAGWRSGGWGRGGGRGRGWIIGPKTGLNFGQSRLDKALSCCLLCLASHSETVIQQSSLQRTPRRTEPLPRATRLKITKFLGIFTNILVFPQKWLDLRRRRVGIRCFEASVAGNKQMVAGRL